MLGVLWSIQWVFGRSAAADPDFAFYAFALLCRLRILFLLSTDAAIKREDGTARFQTDQTALSQT